MSVSKKTAAPVRQASPVRQAWNAPRLNRIGTIADVAGNTGSAFQQGNKNS